MASARVLVVEDRPNMLRLLERILKREYDVVACGDALRARARIEAEEFDLVLTDVRMPKLSGMDLLRIAKQAHPHTEVILLTAYGDIPQSVEAMKEGAYHYLTKPFEPDELLVFVKKALEHRELVRQAEYLQHEIEERFSFANIIGRSEAIRRAIDLVHKAAASDSTVLLLGESGTGKELFARAVHFASGRSSCRFVPVNCGAIPRELIETELFGHVKGAFTGATSAKAGLFDEAEHGTLFLDEIGDLDPALQVKINRAIQEREIRPVGGTTDRKVDVRIIAATNRDLEEMIGTGGFRKDLYYRISVFPIRIPPLRERAEDIPLLATYFVRVFARGQGRKIDGIVPDALRPLLQHDWPGNVRELQNVLERAVVLETGEKVSADVIRECLEGAPRGEPGASVLADLPYKDALAVAQRDATIRYLAALLRRCKGNVTRAAEQAGIERESLHRLLGKVGLKASDFRG